MVYLETHIDIPGAVAPDGKPIPEGALFRASDRWLQSRRSSPNLTPVTYEEYWEAAVAGQAHDAEPSDAPERFRRAAKPEESEGERPEPEGAPSLTDAERAEVARAYIDEQEGQMRDELPDEQPGEDAPAGVRILWALLEGDYQHRRSVLADTSERSARGSGDELEARLLAELYDRQIDEE